VRDLMGYRFAKPVAERNVSCKNETDILARDRLSMLWSVMYGKGTNYLSIPGAPSVKSAA
jgi:hypothetical protein